MGKSIKKVASFALPVIGGALAGPLGISAGLGAAGGGALSGLIGGGGLKGALIGAGTGFAGNAIGSELAGPISKGIGSDIAGTTLGQATGGAANVLGRGIANTTIGSGLANFAGNQVASGLASSLFPQKQNSINMPQSSGQMAAGPAPFKPTQQSPMSVPSSLSGLASLTPEQQSTNIANQGVYGGGQGPEEDKYFLNLLNRRLVDQSGHVASDLNDVNPVENSFLAHLGLGGQSNPTSLLEAINKWQAP